MGIFGARALTRTDGGELGPPHDRRRLRLQRLPICRLAQSPVTLHLV